MLHIPLAARRSPPFDPHSHEMRVQQRVLRRAVCGRRNVWSALTKTRTVITVRSPCPTRTR
jgi:hypothetical protein